MTEETKKPTRQLPDGDRFGLAQHKFNYWVATAEFGTTVEEIVGDPAYFAHMAQRLKPYDHIEVRFDDDSLLLQLIVLEATRSWARVHLLQKHDLQPADVKAGVKAIIDARYEIKLKGPHLRWCVIRKHDGEMLSKQHATEFEARKWLDQYEQRSAVATT